MKLLYEGKAKKLFKGHSKGTVIQYFKDDATAFNAQKKDTLQGKGIINNYISSSIFHALDQTNIPHHFIKRLSDREQLVKEVDIIPIEIIMRKVAAGSICKRLGLIEGKVLPKPLIEFCLKNDSLGDPIISREHIEIMQLADKSEMKAITAITFRVADFLTGFFSMMDIQLIDFKIEFGRFKVANKTHEVILADEISPDNCRLWDIKTNQKLDKDRFREDLGGLIESYSDIANRLSIQLPELKAEK